MEAIASNCITGSSHGEIIRTMAGNKLLKEKETGINMLILRNRPVEKTSGKPFDTPNNAG